MELRTLFHICELRDASVGDLVKLSWGDDDTNLGFVYSIADDYIHLIVLLGSEEVGVAPYSDNFRHDTVCVNYGSDWIIEPEEGSRDGVGYFPTDPGTIGFTAEHAMLALGVRKQGSRARTQVFDLRANDFANRPQASYNIRKWKLWASADHRDSADASPLLLFEAQSPKPR